MNSFVPGPIPVTKAKVDILDRPRCSLDVEIDVAEETPLLDDVLRLQSFSGQEAISQEFEFSLDIRANDYFFADGEMIDVSDTDRPDQTTLDMDTLLGASITVMLGLPETESELQETYPEKRQVSYFNGIIHGISMADRGVWNITMKPQLSILHLQSSYRIFADKTILEVISDVLQENRINHSTKTINEDGSVNENGSSIVKGLANYRRQDWFQAGESDFEFLTRLMEKAGIFYYFVHSPGCHTMVLTDQSYYVPLLKSTESDQYAYSVQGVEPEEIDAENTEWEGNQLRVLYLAGPKIGQDLEDIATQFSFQKNLTVGSVATVLGVRNPMWDPSPEHGNVGGTGELLAGSAQPTQITQAGTVKARKMHKVQMVSYGNSNTEVAFRNEILEKQILSAKSTLSGTCGLAELRSGHKFVIRDLVDRPELSHSIMVAMTVSHKAAADGEYSNQFTAFDAEGFGKPFDGAADHDGSITAVVCDPPLDNRNALENSSFATLEPKTFSYKGESSEKLFKQKGVWVRFIGANDRYFVRLSDSMTTIPEQGTHVVVGRTRDETEIPIIEQVLNAHGSKTILNDAQRSKHTSIGNTYSTNYGNSYSASLPHTNHAITPYDTFNSFLEGERNNYEKGLGSEKGLGRYPDISFHEGSPSYSVSVGYSGINRSKSVVRPSGESNEEKLTFLSNKLTEFDAVPTNGINGDFFGAAIEPKDIDSISHSYKGEVTSFGYSEDYGTSYSESHSHGRSYNLHVDHTSGNYSQSIVKPPEGENAVATIQAAFPEVGDTGDYAGDFNNQDYDEVSQSHKSGVKSYSYSVEEGGYSHSEHSSSGNSYSHSTETGDSRSESYSTGKRYSKSISEGDSETYNYSSGDSYNYSESSGNSRSESREEGSSHSVHHSLGGSYSESHVTTSNSVSTTGASTSSSATGVSNSNSVVGLTNSNSVTGVSTSINILGRSFSLNAHSMNSSITFRLLEDFSLVNEPGSMKLQSPPGEVETFRKPVLQQGPFKATMFSLDIKL